MHVSTLGASASARRRSALSRLIVGGAAAALASVVALATPAHATLLESTVSVTAPTTVTVGDEIPVTIELADSVDLYAYSITLSIDPALLAVVTDSVSGPDGGFTSIDVEGSVVTIVHTRLGTSPGLSGPLTLATLTFTALASGPATIAIPTFEQRDSDTQATIVPNAAEATTTIEPADDATPPPTPPATPAPSTPATPDLSDDGDATPVGNTGGSLSATGVNTGALIVMVAAGLVFLVSGVLALRRRRAVSE